MAKVVTFGELMLRLAPNGYYRFFQNDQMQATFGGGEANVAVSLANYGMDVIDSGVAVLGMHAPNEVVSKLDVYEALLGYVAFLKDMR